MYENVPKKGGSGSRELTWLGGLPDALRKPSIKNSNDPELKASFGGIEAKSFWWRLDDENRCNPVQASAKCYAAVRTFSTPFSMTQTYFTRGIIGRPFNLPPGGALQHIQIWKWGST